MSNGYTVPFERIFAAAMKYSCLPFRDAVTYPDGIMLNLGSGNSPISGCCNLDRPEWTAPLLTGIESGTVTVIHAYHFFEHLERDELRHMLMECERVLKVGGLINYCVPYAMAPIAFMDVDHKTFWTEETMRTLLTSRGYDSAFAGADRLYIVTQWIAGINSQNLAVIGQLQKGM